MLYLLADMDTEGIGNTEGTTPTPPTKLDRSALLISILLYPIGTTSPLLDHVLFSFAHHESLPKPSPPSPSPLEPVQPVQSDDCVLEVIARGNRRRQSSADKIGARVFAD